ncbi:MAG: hypothetical protein IKY02_05615 [Lachnospiraceae bacterium]|nr:hypothetical protein [Lachnospiraceae bacterium]
MRRIFVLLLAIVFILTLGSCTGGRETAPAPEPSGSSETPTASAPDQATEPSETPQPTEEPTTEEAMILSPERQKTLDREARLNDPILAERREKVLAYMRKTVSVLWKSAEKITYGPTATKTPDKLGPSDTLTIRAGEICRGIPYTYGDGTVETLQYYLSEPDEKGVATLSGVDWRHFNHKVDEYRPILGADCSATAVHALSQVSQSFVYSATKGMTEENGYMPVGIYESAPGKIFDNTYQVCNSNGMDRMLEAYALLLPGDGVVHYSGTYGHVMIISDVHVERKADGKINYSNSYVLTIHQTSSYFKKMTKEFDERVGEYVRLFGGLDTKFKFLELFQSGYLPFTVPELTDSGISGAKVFTVTDSESVLSYDTLFKGIIKSEIAVVSGTMEIRDENGNVEQTGVYISQRQNPDLAFNLAWFLTIDSTLMPSHIDPEAIPSGKHQCVLTVMLSNGETLPARDFWFEKP